VRIYVYPAGLDACAYYRLIWPGNALAAAGHDVRVVMPEERNGERYQLTARLNADGRPVDVQVPEDADVLVLQRVSHRNLSACIELIRNRGVAVVIDMDDNFNSIHRKNPAHPYLDPRNGGDHTWVNAEYSASQATWVTTSTEALQRVYARHGRGSVIMNMIPSRAFDLPVRESRAVGWTGSLHSHPDDPYPVGSAAMRLVREGHPFHMVGVPNGIARAFRVPEDQMTATGVLPIEEWLDHQSDLRVGLTPLADTVFNAGKSWLKPLELAACGVPAVMSPRAEYRRIHALGVGVLARGGSEWYREAKRLLTNDAAWTEASERGREAVRKLTIEDNAWRWLEAWEHAGRIERGIV
jgi:hypothetical protein